MANGILVPLTSRKWMRRARRNTRCLPHCWRAHPIRRCSIGWRRCAATRRRSAWRTPRSRLREQLTRLGIERADGESEPEDHAAILCEIMAGLINGRLAAEAGADRDLFEKHLSPWIGRFFADLEQAEAAGFYRNVGTLGRLFVDIETEAFALPS
jgi:TorA maturation chaperone TorD